MEFQPIPWDFVLILLALGTLVPWRGVVRVKRLLARKSFRGDDRMSLYYSTITYQWLMVGIVAWRAFSRDLSTADLGLILSDPWKTAWIALAMTSTMGAYQFASLRMMSKIPELKQGLMFRLTSRLMPRTPTESVTFSALACTAGLSEEFLYRGFVFAVFARVFAGFAHPILIAAIMSSAWFAAGHLYQGKRGLITTFIVGMIFLTFRLWSGNLAPPILAHAGIDLIAGLYASKILRKC